MFFMLTLGSTKKFCVTQKTVVSNKQKIFQIEVNVAQKNMLWQQKKLCDTQKKIHVDQIRLVLHRKGIRLQKMVPVLATYKSYSL